ncbi:major core protein [Broome reovirus]|uniref:Major core protein n=1 Tax=Broome reovirus TaxID=667093 RepID=D6MM20_9REOV|nr:major core protein [Broome reovirus]ACU68600.1 major core protein [Broome reovirus]
MDAFRTRVKRRRSRAPEGKNTDSGVNSESLNEVKPIHERTDLNVAHNEGSTTNQKSYISDVGHREQRLVVDAPGKVDGYDASDMTLLKKEKEEVIHPVHQKLGGDAANDPNARYNQNSDPARKNSSFSYTPEGNVGLNELERSKRIDHDGGVKTQPVREEVQAMAQSVLSTRPLYGGLPSYNHELNSHVCMVCMRAFMSPEQLAVHQTTHSLGAVSGLMSYEVSQAVIDFVASWSRATATANVKSGISVDEIDDLLLNSAPLLVTWDAGLCTSFTLVPIIPARTVQDVIAYQWFSSSYNIETPFPQGSVVRIVLQTNWAGQLDHDRGRRVKQLPPTSSNVPLFRQAFNHGLTPSNAFNPRLMRSNVILMCLDVVLDNLHLNRNTAYALDLTAALTANLGAKQLRAIGGDNPGKWYPIMYPSRVRLPNASKTAEFVNHCLEDRVGRFDRSQTFSGAMSDWADTYETLDSLTHLIRTRWYNRLQRMNMTPNEIADALSRCAKHLLTISASQAPSMTRLMPFRVTTPERQLLQIMYFLNVGTNAGLVEPIISNAARMLAKMSPLMINPQLVADAIASVVEQTTNSISPAAALLMRLRPNMADFSDFRRSCICFLYNGMVTTYLDEQSFPVHRGNVLSVDTLIDMFICLMALPMTTDPNGPVKAFMVLANAMYGFENITMDDPNWNQQRAAASFNNPRLWPRCFVQRTIDRARCPVLARWADMIYQYWPRPGATTFGAPDILGSANLFTGPDELLLPFQVTAPNTVSPTLSLVNELCNWRNAVIDMLVGIVNDGRFMINWNPAMRASMTNALTKFKIIRSYTPGYMCELLPIELAALAPILPLQPLQVPYAGLDRNAIPVHMNVSRQAPHEIAQPALHMSMTQQFVGVPIAVNARPITVALLSGTYPENPPLITNVWYAAALAPLYSHDGLFSHLQHAVVVSEAYQTVIACLSQCTNMRFPVDRVFEWIPQIELGANESANLARHINEAFRMAFGLTDESILLQPFLEGDPRATQLTIAYTNYVGDVRSLTPVIPDSMIAETIVDVGRVLRHEYNCFGICKGDIIIGQLLTESGFNPLAPPSSVVFDETMDDVHVFNHRTIATFGMNGGEMTVEDAAGNHVPLRGRWVMPLDLWQINNAFFKTILPTRLRSGQLMIRLRLGAFPYVLQYFNARDPMDGFDMLQQWFDSISPTGIAPVPFLMPESQDHNVSSGLAIHYIWATEYNDGSLFCTNSSSPATVFGPDKSIPLERYSVLTDEDFPPRGSQLPAVIDFYGLIRRYNLETPPLTAAVTTYGSGLPMSV